MKPNPHFILNTFKDYSSIIFFFFYIFIFPRIEAQIIPPLQVWLTSLGFWAPLGYILAGLTGTVVAPFGLGPINIVLHKAFGFWPSVLYYSIYEIVGMSINFYLSKVFGHKIIQFFFGMLGQKDEKGKYKDPITNLSNYMLDKNYWTAFIVMLGLGGELLAYLAGLSKLKFWKFLSIILIVTPLNGMLFVGRNLTIGTDNTKYILLQILTFCITFLPISIVFRKEIIKFFNHTISNFKQDPQNNKNMKQLAEDFLNKDIKQEQFADEVIRCIQKDLDTGGKFINLFLPTNHKYYQNVMDEITSDYFSKIEKHLDYTPDIVYKKIKDHTFVLKLKDSDLELKYHTKPPQLRGILIFVFSLRI